MLHPLYLVGVVGVVGRPGGAAAGLEGAAAAGLERVAARMAVGWAEVAAVALVAVVAAVASAGPMLRLQPVVTVSVGVRLSPAMRLLDMLIVVVVVVVVLLPCHAVAGVVEALMVVAVAAVAA